MISLTVNGQVHEIDVEPDKPLLWVLREDLNIVGPKFGCGVAACGACTVHVERTAVRSCSFPVSDAAGKSVVTVEGLSQGGQLHAVQRAWIENQVPQCGYCQPGFIMAAVALLQENPKPTDSDIDDVLSNICRCGTYSAIRRAVHRAAAILGGAS
jgi:isoquinoline 1-oxidoreductase alpha subunit